MSSILLSNPFVTPLHPVSAQQEVFGTLAILPTKLAGSSKNTDDATSFGGSGTGTSKQADTAALLRKAQNLAEDKAPQDAQSRSVIVAQAVPTPAPILFQVDSPKVDMPDPLPTSPFLKTPWEPTWMNSTKSNQV